MPDEIPQLGQKIRRAFGIYLDMTARFLQGEVTERSPVETGRLQNSWFLDRAGEFVRNVFSTAGYAFVVSEGSDPYTITPNDAQALRFEVDGQVIYAKSVQHPGIEGSGYIGEAIEATESRLEQFANEAFDEVGL